jgi:hypothetical protein
MNRSSEDRQRVVIDVLIRQSERLADHATQLLRTAAEMHRKAESIRAALEKAKDANRN